MKQDYAIRVQTLLIVKLNDSQFKTIDSMSYKAKNIYNSALYIARDYWFKHNTVIGYKKLHEQHKKLYFSDYTSLPSQTTQQILRVVSQNMKSFVRTNIDFEYNGKKYKSEPKLPRYKHKEKGRCPLYFTNQQVRFIDGYIHFPTSTCIQPVKTHLDLSVREENKIFSRWLETPIHQVRIIPMRKAYKVEVVYEKEIKIPEPQDNSDRTNVAAIDLGLNNFATVVIYGQEPIRPLLINGRGLKSYNKNFNAKLEEMRKKKGTAGNAKKTTAVKRLYAKRGRIYLDFYHKASRAIIDYLVQNNVSTLIVGFSRIWRKDTEFYKKPEQGFEEISFRRFMDLLKYKCYEQGIHVIIQEESYSSGTSFLDRDYVEKIFYKESRRISRGAFRHSNPDPMLKPIINADVNAAYQILSKASGNKLLYNPDYITQKSLTPIMVNIDTFT